MLGRLIRDLGDLQMQNISAKKVKDWLYGLRTTHRTDQWGRRTNPGITAATYNQHVSNLRGFFGWRQAQGFMRHNRTINLSLMKIQRKVRQLPNPVVLAQMLETPTFPRDPVMVVSCSIACGE